MSRFLFFLLTFCLCYIGLPRAVQSQQFQQFLIYQPNPIPISPLPIPSKPKKDGDLYVLDSDGSIIRVLDTHSNQWGHDIHLFQDSTWTSQFQTDFSTHTYHAIDAQSRSMTVSPLCGRAYAVHLDFDEAGIAEVDLSTNQSHRSFRTYFADPQLPVVTADCQSVIVVHDVMNYQQQGRAAVFSKVDVRSSGALPPVVLPFHLNSSSNSQTLNRIVQDMTVDPTTQDLIVYAAQDDGGEISWSPSLGATKHKGVLYSFDLSSQSVNPKHQLDLPFNYFPNGAKLLTVNPSRKEIDVLGCTTDAPWNATQPVSAFCTVVAVSTETFQILATYLIDPSRVLPGDRTQTYLPYFGSMALNSQGTHLYVLLSSSMGFAIQNGTNEAFNVGEMADITLSTGYSAPWGIQFSNHSPLYSEILNGYLWPDFMQDLAVRDDDQFFYVLSSMEAYYPRGLPTWPALFGVDHSPQNDHNVMTATSSNLFLGYQVEFAPDLYADGNLSPFFKELNWSSLQLNQPFSSL